jgi:hypothetical protein
MSPVGVHPLFLIGLGIVLLLVVVGGVALAILLNRD